MTTASEARQGVIDLTALAVADLRAVWTELADLPPEQVRDGLADVLPVIGDTYGVAAAALAADWFDDAREAAGAGGYYRAEPAPDVEQARWLALARWGVDPLFAEQPDPDAVLSRVTGGLQRTVADRHRLTVVDNSIRDPQASGWKRVGVGGNCGFCRMLIDRGHVYTEASVTFRSHDHCNCAASPSWAPNVTKVSREPYRQSQRNRSEATKRADNQRAYAFIRDTADD